jgi:hypothetical protein
MPVSDTHAREVYAKAVLREVPLSHLQEFLDNVDEKKAAAGIGQGCGVGCLRHQEAETIDRYGHTELTRNQLQTVLSDKKALRDELKKQVQHMTP